MVTLFMIFVHHAIKISWENLTRKRKISREAVGGSFRQCGVCKVGEKIMKRCSGSYLVWYCGREWQLGHWLGCNRTQLDYKIFFLTDNQEKGKNRKTGQVFSRMTGDRPKKSHLIDKVIIMSSKLYWSEVKTIHCMETLSNNSPSNAEIIKAKIIREGNKARNGLFYALMFKFW